MLHLLTVITQHKVRSNGSERSSSTCASSVGVTGRELDLARAQSQEPLIEEVATLTRQLNEARMTIEESQAAAQQAVAEARLARSNSQWAVDSVAALERCGMPSLCTAPSQFASIKVLDTRLFQAEPSERFHALDIKDVD